MGLLALLYVIFYMILSNLTSTQFLWLYPLQILCVVGYIAFAVPISLSLVLYVHAPNIDYCEFNIGEKNINHLRLTLL